MKPGHLLVFLSLFTATLAFAGTSVTISLDNGARSIEVHETSPGLWTCRIGDITWSVQRQGPNIAVRRDDTTVGTGTLEAGKLKVRAKDGALLFALTVRDDKVKLVVQGSATPYEFKYKENKIKVVYRDEAVGKVKFYPESGKLKAKGPDDQVVAVSRDLGRLSASLGPFLVPGLDDATRVPVVLTLLALGK